MFRRATATPTSKPLNICLRVGNSPYYRFLIETEAEPLSNAFEGMAALVDDFDRRLRRIEEDVAHILELLQHKRASPEVDAVRRNKKLAYTLREASETTGLSRAKFYGLFKEGKLRRSKAGGRTLILAAELERYLREST